MQYNRPNCRVQRWEHESEAGEVRCFLLHQWS
ncbi:hypothetical protein LINPERPRIM_LOCUS39307 [Linum perenne]